MKNSVVFSGMDRYSDAELLQMTREIMEHEGIQYEEIPGGFAILGARRIVLTVEGGKFWYE